MSTLLAFAAIWLSSSVLQAAQPYLEVGGRVVVEGEHFAARTANADGHNWHVVPDEDNYPVKYPNFVFNNARGSFVMVLPDSGVNHTTAANWNTNPFVDYTFHIETLGTYQLYLRWRGWDGGSDSLYAQMLGKSDGIGVGPINDYYQFSGGSGGSFNGSWRGTALPETTGTGTAVAATWDITTPGDYTIRISYREDGCAIDTVCFQLQTLPAPTDPGPGESPLITVVPFVRSQTPNAGALNVFPSTSFSAQIQDGSGTALAEEDPTFLLNGAPLTYGRSRSGTVTTLAAASPGWLQADSTNTLTLIYKDTANASFTNSWQFTVGVRTELPVGFLVPAAQISTAQANSGFLVNLHQVRRYDTNLAAITSGLPNTSDRAEGELRGYLLDPATGLPYTNNFSVGTGVVFGDAFDDLGYPETYINWNINPQALSGTDRGNFRTDYSDLSGGYPDAPPPGYYSGRLDPTFTVNFAYELTTYLDLPAGLIRLGVNSDDGFRVTCGPNTRDRYDISKVVLLGTFEGGRGAADTTFDIVVAQAGIYPIRLLWYQGTGDANLEFFEVKPDGTKVLINDIAVAPRAGNSGTIKAYRQATLAPQHAVVDWLSPAPNALNVATGAVVQVQLGDSASATVLQNSIRLLFNGAPVTPAISNTAPRTLLTYTPPGALPEGSTNTAQVEFTDSLGASVTQSWEFVVAVVEPVVPNTGEVTRKIWEGITGGTIASLRAWPDFQQNVNYNSGGQPAILTAFEQPQFNPALNTYGQQFLGYLKPAVTADYTFYLGSDDASELWLSTDASPANQVLIATQTGYNGFREYLTGRNPYARHSAPIHLEAGQRYFVQALHKEGTGGDNFSVAWWRAGDPPITNGSPSITGSVLEKFVGAAFVEHPQSQTIKKGLPVTLSADAILGTGTISYQWLHNGSPVPGANALSYLITSVQLADAGQYLLRISIDGVNYDSQVATLTVNDDTTPPTVLAAYGMIDSTLVPSLAPGAYTVGVQFSEPLDTNAALNTATITVSGNTVNARSVGTDNSVLLLQMASTLPTSFTVTLNGIRDAAGNPLPDGTLINAALSSMVPAVVGTIGVDPVDYYNMAAYSFNQGSFHVIAGGSDIWNSADGCSLIYTLFTGDFEAQVQVESLVLANTWSKAGIMARENLSPGSRNVFLQATPTLGQNVYSFSWRNVADAGCGSKAGAERIYGLSYPDVWLRLTRQGDTFQAYIKTNGVDWLLYHTYTAPSNYPPALYVGLATTSHDNTGGKLTTAVYRDWQIRSIAAPKLGFHTEADKAVLTWDASGILLEAPDITGPWTTNTTATSPFTITPSDPSRFYRLLQP